MFSLTNIRHRLFLPDMVKPLARQGQLRNMPRLTLGLLEAMSTLAMYNPIFSGLIPVIVWMTPLSFRFLIRAATVGWYGSTSLAIYSWDTPGSLAYSEDCPVFLVDRQHADHANDRNN